MNESDKPKRTYSVQECINAIRNKDPKNGFTDGQVKQIVLNTWVEGKEDIKKIKSELTVWRKEFIEAQRKFLETHRIMIFVPKNPEGAK